MSDKALIFAGGSALSVLAKNDVAIHFSSAIDKKAEEKKNGFFETIFFHSLALSHNCLKKVHGEKILVGNDGLLLENFLFSGEKLDTGWTVATFLLSIAHFLGCSPIYFTGLDFCFSKKKYGGDVEGDEKYDIETEDIFGNKVFTQKDWILAVRWIEDFAKKASLVNANKAGLKIKNVKEGSFDLKKSFDFTGLIHSVVSPLKHIAMPKEEIQKKLNDIEKSALECLKIADFYLQDLEKDFQNGFFAQDYSLENFEKELFFGELLFPLWNTYSYVIKRKIKNEKNNLPEHFLVFLNKLLFFKNVINDYLTLGKKWKNMP